MTSVLISQHSSNPFEGSSPDPRNHAYKKAVAEAGRAPDMESSSEDELAKNPQFTAYWTHINNTVPNVHVQQSKNYGRKALSVSRGMDVVDLDEDMDSEDELTLKDPPQVWNDATGEGGNGDAMEVDSAEDDSDDLEILSDEDDGEEDDIRTKDPQERAEIEAEIEELNEKVPTLKRHYKIVDRLGTGTFSSVYKAIDLKYHKWFNDSWHGHHPPESSAHYQSVPHPPRQRVYVAVKRIYVTSSPERIRNEIAIMNDCRGCRHISQLITAFRHEDQVVAIMPYQRNADFRDFFMSLSMTGIKAYFRCLLRGLRDIHARQIIHRDVKPANFLFDPQTGHGTLCDFGLASRITPPHTGPGACLHSTATDDHPHGSVSFGKGEEVEIKSKQRDARQKSQSLAQQVGYPTNDRRPHSKANRAGTRGFRAPEVLFKCMDQTGAVDVWSAGVILLFFLTRKFPLFQSNDDVEALMEIATIVGMKKIEKVATLHGRTFASNVPAITQEGKSWRSFCEAQNETILEPPTPNPHWFPHATKKETKAQHLKDLTNVFELLEGLLHPHAVHRWTPKQALKHAFLREEQDDDLFFPHPFGKGVCGGRHAVRDGRPSVFDSRTRRWKEVESGQGIAIGKNPCEFHKVVSR